MRARIAIGALVIVAACGHDLDEPEDFGVCTERRVTELFAARCAECHDANRPDGDLDLVSPGVAERLVGVLSTSRPCRGRPRVDRDGGGYHLLLDKLRPSPGCGMRMPRKGAYLSVEDTACVQAWVEALAAGGTL